jgi:hypothetical protein
MKAIEINDVFLAFAKQERERLKKELKEIDPILNQREFKMCVNQLRQVEGVIKFGGESEDEPEAVKKAVEECE